MNEIISGEKSVYEIGYLIASSIPEEAVPSENEALHDIVSKSGASIIAEEAPKRQPLAYTMRKKTVSGSYMKYDEAYFGWIKFEVESDKVDGIKKTIEARDSIVRILVISTVKENTYLGKRASLIAADIVGKKDKETEDIKTGGAVPVEAKDEESKPQASVEEIDKSIDEIVKEV